MCRLGGIEKRFCDDSVEDEAAKDWGIGLGGTAGSDRCVPECLFDSEGGGKTVKFVFSVMY